MNETGAAYRNIRTGKYAKAREASGAGSTVLLEPDIAEDGDPSDWKLGFFGPEGKFYPVDRSISFVVKFPDETTEEVERLIEETGGDATEFFKRAIGLYKLARDAVHDGKAVGIASSPDALETQFVGL
jgi:hypothetical protein